MHVTRSSLLALAFALGVDASGCYARYEAPPPMVVVSPAPIEIETQPYVVYQGTPVYWVEGRWYRRYGNGWGYYRDEPPYLAQRRPGVTTAPPAYPRRPPPNQPPPARPNQPPPAPPNQPAPMPTTHAPPAH